MSAYTQYGYTYPSASQLLVAGQPTTGTSPPLGASASASSLSPGSTSAPGPVSPGAASAGGAAAAAAPSHGPGSTPTGSCCETGRPIMTDPVSGQTVCSCQYDPTRLTLSYPRLSTSGVGVYGAPYPSTDQNPYPSIGVDSSAFYSPLSNPYALKDTTSSTDMTAWTSASLQTTTGYYPYDPTLAAYGYGAGYDLAARRKNATRESTATLKAWLNEHKKNPYPTKGEKIMLAIITKMTLTQVSTWFANARRRLKKENKMTWEPKNKTDDDDDAIVSDGDDKEKDDLGYDADKIKDRLRDDKDGMTHHVKLETRHDKDLDDDEETDDEDRKPDALGLGHGHHHHHLAHHHHSHMHHSHHSMLAGLKDEMKSPPDCGIPIPATKPKIWSLADTAACKTPPPPPQHQSHHQQLPHQPHHQQQQQQPWLVPASATCGAAGPVAGMNVPVNTFPIPSTAMSPATASAAPYSRYGGFLGHYNGNGHAAMGNYNGGFPEVQTDTPPQTPPNMKLPSVANNIINSNPCYGGQSTSSSSTSSSSSSYHHNGFVNNFNRMQSNQLSPQKERQDGSFAHQQTMRPLPGQQHQGQVNPNEGTAFKPFFKSSPPLNNGFVSPV